MTPTLNHDVLAEVVQYLSTRDALVYGATCHFLRPLTIRHAVDDVKFGSAAHLTNFCHFMLADPHARIPHLRSLTILAGIAKQPRTFHGCLGSLAELLSGATNLTSLSLPCVDLLLTIEPALFDAITKLTSLTSLSLSSFGNDTQAMLLQLHCTLNLQRLWVAEEWTIAGEATARYMTLPPMPNLRTLVLSNVRSPPLRTTLPTIAPSLQNLHLSNVEFNTVDLAHAQGTWWTSFDHIRGDLRSLRLLRIPRPVRSLELDVVLDRQRDWDPAPLFDVLAAASPQRLALGMRTSFNHLFWHIYGPVMPRVRYLELLVADSDPASSDLEDWLDNISHAGPSSLLALAIYVQRPPQDPLAHTPVPSAGPIDTQLAPRLLRALSRAIPSLRLLALSIGTRPESQAERDPYAVFGGREFNWWCAEKRFPLPLAQSAEEKRASPAAIAMGAAEGGCETDWGKVRGWRRVAEHRGVQLFDVLRGTDFEAIGQRKNDVDAHLAPYV